MGDGIALGLYLAGVVVGVAVVVGPLAALAALAYSYHYNAQRWAWKLGRHLRRRHYEADRARRDRRAGRVTEATSYRDSPAARSGLGL